MEETPMTEKTINLEDAEKAYVAALAARKKALDARENTVEAYNTALAARNAARDALDKADAAYWSALHAYEKALAKKGAE
jgi:hypothetical protein